MKKKLPISFLLALISSNALAVQIKETFPDEEIEAFIAADELSRIKVINNRIKSVRSNEGDVEVVEDAALGEIYIRPTKGGRNPVNIFVTTERNNTYKLLLVPHKTPSEQIFIKSVEESLMPSSKKKGVIHESFKERIIGLVRAMQMGKESPGFKKVKNLKTETIAEDEYKVIESYTSARIKAHVLEVDSDFELEKLQSQVGIIALSLSGEGGESKKLYIVMEARDEHA
ncbi:MAG: type-F conjugative transfer system secretin TraK [Verrucomicrobia bacterium]|nr:type-F conjugative transfer system secretin TraK [Verrucomicrobiota bacterium]